MSDTIIIPTAKGHLPVGTSREECVRHNRMRKSSAIALRLHLDGHRAARVTAADMEAAALRSNVHPPNSEQTRAQVRSLLAQYEDTASAPGSNAKPRRRPRAALTARA